MTRINLFIFYVSSKVRYVTKATMLFVIIVFYISFIQVLCKSYTSSLCKKKIKLGSYQVFIARHIQVRRQDSGND